MVGREELEGFGRVVGGRFRGGGGGGRGWGDVLLLYHWGKGVVMNWEVGGSIKGLVGYC